MVAETMMAVGDLVIRKAGSHRCARAAQNEKHAVAFESDTHLCERRPNRMMQFARPEPGLAQAGVRHLYDCFFHRTSYPAFAAGLFAAIVAAHSNITTGSCHPRSFGELLRKAQSERF
jgi:hypothetical protein